MLEKFLKLEGAQKLTKNQQKSIRGGIACSSSGTCPKGSYCNDDTGVCLRGQ